MQGNRYPVILAGRRLLFYFPSRNLQGLLWDVIFTQKALTARNVQFYVEEEIKMQQTLREVCAELKVSRRAVQGYEKEGLVAPCGKNKYGYLLYGEPERERIRLIRFYQQLGFQLREIKKLLDADNSVRKAAIQVKVEELEAEDVHLQEIIRQAKGYIATL